MARPKQTPWRQDVGVLARLEEVERRHLKGEHNTAIAAALGVTETTIRNDLKRLRELWLERTGGSVEEMRARAIAELLEIKDRALSAAAFDEMAERAVLFGEPGPNGELVKRDHKGSAQFRGNKAAAIAQARQAIMDAAKLMGIVVDKVAPTDPNGGALDLASLVLAARKERDGDGNA